MQLFEVEKQQLDQFLIKSARDVLVFLKFCKNFSERRILWSLCSVVFHALTLKLPIHTSLSVTP